jgi:Holliday junction resolvase RusA-like endonuclease
MLHPRKQPEGKSRSTSREYGVQVFFKLDMPPSTNNLYVKRRGKGGQLALSDEARSYREHVKSVIAKHIVPLSAMRIGVEEVYRFDMVLYLNKLENPGWFQRFTKGANKGQRKAKTRYKRIDIDNRQKFVQDCVARGLGFDDSQFFEGSHSKSKTDKEDHVLVTVHHLDPTKFGLELPDGKEDT